MVQAVLDALAAPDGGGDLRTRPQRYHDALEEAMRRRVFCIVIDVSRGDRSCSSVLSGCPCVLPSRAGAREADERTCVTLRCHRGRQGDMYGLDHPASASCLAVVNQLRPLPVVWIRSAMDAPRGLAHGYRAAAIPLA
jgi:hypothetical protein